MKLRLLKITLGIIVIILFYWLYKILFLDIPKIEGNPFNPNKIATQTFKIKPDKDTVLTTKSGSLIVLHKNSFINAYGHLAEGTIEIHFKEILTKGDIIQSGLTTTSNGRFLESGGMINVRAFNEGQEVFLGDSSKIGFAIQTDTVLPDMQIFAGQIQQDKVNWVSPSPLFNDTAFCYSVVKSWNPDEISRDEAIAQGIIVVDTLTGDRIFEEVDLAIPMVDAAVAEEVYEPMNFSNNTGYNAFLEDVNQKYVFELFNLGWANIDRLLNDKRTQLVDLTTSVSNYQEFGQVYITMVVTNKSMYLPGYQKQDLTFSFTHGDYEETKLPVGEEAIIIATSSKKGVPYIAIKHITIKKEQSVQLTLIETTDNLLKKMMEDNI